MTVPEHPNDEGSSSEGDPLSPAPDFSEEQQQNPDLINVVVPTRGYGLLPVVGLGGSAGSIPALQAFFENTPVDTGFAYVVVLHLARDHESTLPALLQRHCKMPVHAAADGDELLADRVLVIPPGWHLQVDDGHLRLTPMQQELGRRVAVDLFFRSLADTHGPHATAVVLSGAGGDGAIGLKRIKECGGLTIAQDPREAGHTGMPGSAIDTGMVDWVLSVRDMPARILAYHANEARLRVPPEEGPQPAKPAEPPADHPEALLREVLALLHERTGRDFAYYKRATIVRRISHRMQVCGVVELGDYLDHLRQHPGEAGTLLQDLLISVTNFFRDRQAFESIERHIPELFRNKQPGESVRVWCAACATGEEAYSMAMLLLEHARLLEQSPTLQVFGCDLDEQAIQVARAGFYPDTIAADVSEERLRRFFTKEPGGWRVRRELREMVLLASHDLLKDAPFSRMDLISCRNLLIYLNRDAQAHALETFSFALKPGGLLFLGVSESVEEGSALFSPVQKRHRIYRQRPAHRAALSIPIGAAGGVLQRVIEHHDRLKHTAAMLPRRAFLTASTQPSMANGPSSDFGDTPANELHFRLLGRFGPASLVVDPEHDIVHLSENANRFLQMPEGAPTRNLLRLALPTLRVELRAALLRAQETLQPVRELIRTNATLRPTVEQYEASTEELKASNEELQAMNEELRSAGEELETGCEELQSVNEELTTVNAEFRSRVEELARTNSDLHNLMSATQIATVFLGRDLQVMRYTPPAAPLFNLIPSDVGRPISHLNRRLDYPELAADAEQVLRTLVPVERQLREDGHWYLTRVLPYRTIDDHIAGVVLTFIDITERRQAEEALRQSGERLQLIVENAREYAIFATDLQRCITSWNAGAEHILGYTQQQAIGEPADMIFTPEDRMAGVPEQETAKALAEGRASDERWHLRSDGTRFWGSGIMMPMRDVGGEAIGFVKIIRDQTAELHAKQTLEQSRERLRLALQETEAARDEAQAAGKAKDRFLAVLSHELRAPLTPLLLAAQVLARDKSLPESTQHTLAIIERNVRLQAHLVDELLDVTRISIGKLEFNREPTSLREIVALAGEISMPDIEAKGQRVILELAADGDALFGDVKRLQQVFWNLLKNASKFTPIGGTITIRSHIEAGRCVVDVHDTGRGFEPDASERIFAAFQQASADITREFGGLGLGLAIARATVEAHGGTIRAVSTGVGTGATFTLILPVADPP